MKKIEKTPRINFLTLIQTARLNFLVLTLAVIFMTVATTAHFTQQTEWLKVVLVVIGASFAHLSVNFLNEYQDFHSGLDKLTQKTPFSGGSGGLVSNPKAANLVLLATWFSLIIVIASGILLAWMTSLWLLLFGVIGIALIVFYTRYITRFPWLCLVAPGLAFGPIMIIGGSYALTGQIHIEIVVLSMVVFFLVNNLLLLNQIPDLEADKSVGRFNILMLLGTEQGIQIFAAFVWLAFITLGLSIWLFDLPPYTWFGFLPLLGYFPLLRDLQFAYENLAENPKLLAMNVLITILTPVFIGIGFII